MASRSAQPAVPIYDSAATGNLLVTSLRDLYAYRGLVGRLVRRNVTTRYKRSVLGVAWTMLNPLLTMAVMALVFSNLFRANVEHFPVYLLGGILCWNFFAQTSSAIMTELLWGGALIRHLYVPRTVFSLAAMGTGLVNFGLSLVPLAVLVVILGVPLSWSLLSLPLAIVLLSAFTLGLGLLLSIFAIEFSDIIDMYHIFLMAWMYLTPVIYPMSIISPENQWLYYLNPMYYFVTLVRDPIHLGIWPEPTMLLGAFLFAAVALTAGLTLFVKRVEDLVYRI